MHKRTFFIAAFLLGLVSLLAPPPAAGAASVAPGDGVAMTSNSLETHDYHIQNARIPGLLAARQNVTAWQVTQGSWNGQNLDGLFVVFVQSTSEGGAVSRQTNCYISQEATLAQRSALVDAFLASNTQTVTPQDVATMRIEPAIISVEMDGEAVVLHLGLLA